MMRQAAAAAQPRKGPVKFTVMPPPRYEYDALEKVGAAEPAVLLVAGWPLKAATSRLSMPSSRFVVVGTA